MSDPISVKQEEESVDLWANHDFEEADSSVWAGTSSVFVRASSPVNPFYTAHSEAQLSDISSHVSFSSLSGIVTSSAFNGGNPAWRRNFLQRLLRQPVNIKLPQFSLPLSDKPKHSSKHKYPAVQSKTLTRKSRNELHFKSRSKRSLLLKCRRHHHRDGPTTEKSLKAGIRQRSLKIDFYLKLASRAKAAKKRLEGKLQGYWVPAYLVFGFTGQIPVTVSGYITSWAPAYLVFGFTGKIPVTVPGYITSWAPAYLVFGFTGQIPVRVPGYITSRALAYLVYGFTGKIPVTVPG
ncbi:hypothetical protein CPC08DRAFT_729920 [Agrocybe pediades]|nr:hypothetical protein CPC08DRAFT_729920 [Agrocybe pediades]